MDPVAEPVHVEERERQQEAIVGGEAPGVDQHARVGAQIAVRDHGALGRAGRAGRVDERGRRGGIEGRVDRRDDAGRRRLRQQVDAPCRHVRYAPTWLIDDHHRLRRRVAEDVIHLAVAIQDVDRDDNHAKPRARQKQVDVLEAVGQVDRQPIAGGETTGGQFVRHPRGTPVEVRERVLLTRPFERDGVRTVAEGCGEQGREGRHEVPKCRSAEVLEC